MRPRWLKVNPHCAQISDEFIVTSCLSDDLPKGTEQIPLNVELNLPVRGCALPLTIWVPFDHPKVTEQTHSPQNSPSRGAVCVGVRVGGCLCLRAAEPAELAEPVELVELVELVESAYLKNTKFQMRSL